TGAPADALVAIQRLDMGPGAYHDDYSQFDILLVYNLTVVNLANPQLGVILPGSGNQSYKQALLTRGFARDSRFGGFGGNQTLTALNAGAVWAILIPSTSVTINASIDGSIGPLQNVAIANNQTVFLRVASSAAVTVPQMKGLDDIAVASNGQIYGASSQ